MPLSLLSLSLSAMQPAPLSLLSLSLSSMQPEAFHANDANAQHAIANWTLLKYEKYISYVVF